MKIDTVRQLLDAQVACGDELLDTEVFSACGSDMMSDVLAYVKDQAVLLTGLINEQVIRTAAMMDMRCVVFVRGKLPSPDMVDLAWQNGIVVLTSAMRMFEACGTLYCSGLNPQGKRYV
jgi:predicted transcriptional regulator